MQYLLDFFFLVDNFVDKTPAKNSWNRKYDHNQKAYRANDFRARNPLKQGRDKEYQPHLDNSKDNQRPIIAQVFRPVVAKENV